MRNRFDRQLLELNNELIQMGSLIEQAIEMGISALVKQDVEKAEQAIKFDVEVDEQEKTIEALCMKLLLQQQPVAKDLRLISAALKMITDMERIGDHAADISEMTILMADSDYEKSAINMEVIKEMAKETTDMVIKSVDAFVNKDLELARWVINRDDVVDDLFDSFRKELIQKINENVKKGIDTPLILWSVDTLDWKTKNTDATVKTILKHAKDGDIVLMHDIHKPTVAAVEKVLPILKKKGYEVCTVSELLEAKGVKAGKGDKVFSATDIIRK